MEKGKIVSIEDRIPKLKQQRRKKANRRLITLLILFFSLIAVIIYFQSPLSRVKMITVTGNESYSQPEIVAHSGIAPKSNIWKLNENKVAKKLKQLPEIKTARIKVKFPNTIVIHIEEHGRIAYVSKGTNFYPVLESGAVLEKRQMAELPVNAPLLVGFNEGEPLDEMIAALKTIPDEVVNSISEIQYKPSKTDAYRITLFMNDGYEVNASLRSFAEKMVHYPSIVTQLEPGKQGVIDLEVGSYFKAYEAEEAEKVEIEKETEQ
ncbi:cell division protein FtsQ/DivIB [Bacillus sp. T33-2]|uniref:cell division protein FtsQ/DivIB n=1 Tax=Bacillus sp. T33-2 TaxID=2054168 RepID=UPI000C787C9E|nr:cell division protein FtsQ/DivIB [Bacillus sp. T33-2]PLR97374.1 cell division protein FtsQ [Bacillus sp. T33-2]